MKRMGMMSRIAAVVIGLAVAAATLSFASAQQGPPHRFYGTDATPGDEIAAVVEHDGHYDTVGTATVDENGGWYIDVDADMADEIEFTVNGEHAEAAITSAGENQSSVVLTVAMMDEGDDDAMMGEDEDGEMMEDDDSMMEDDDSMLDEDDSMEGDDVGYPAGGSGGLAGSTSGISAGLIGLLIALGAAAIAALGIRRVRSRA